MMAALPLLLFALASAPTSPATTSVPLATPAGTRSAQRAVRLTSITAASGVKVHAAVLVIYDASSRLYWHANMRDRKSDAIAQTNENQFSLFRFATDGTSLAGAAALSDRLLARRSQTRAATFDEAIALATRATERELEQGWPATREIPHSQYVEYDLSTLLGGEFVWAGRGVGGPAELDATRVDSISPHEGLWQLVIRNFTGATSTVALTPDLQLVRDDAATRSRRQKE